MLIVLAGCAGDVALGVRSSPGEPSTEPSLLVADVVHSVEFDPEPSNALEIDPWTWSPATLVLDGEPVEGAGVRRWLAEPDDLEYAPNLGSFEFDLDAFPGGEPVAGIDRFVLRVDREWSHLRTALAYRIYREAGVPAPRAVHATVTLLGASRGLYTVVEGLDAPFLARWFADPTGPRFDLSGVDFVPADVATFDHEGGPDDRAALDGLARALEDEDATVFGELAAWVDPDAFVRYFAVAAVIGQFDGYPFPAEGGTASVYVDPVDDRIRFVPGDGSDAFTDADRPADYVFGALAVRCLAEPDCTWAWTGAVEDVLDLLDEVDLGAERSLVDPWVWSVADTGDVLAFVSGRRASLARTTAF